MDAIYQAMYGKRNALSVLTAAEKLVGNSAEWKAVMKGIGVRAHEPIELPHHEKRFWSCYEVYQTALASAEGLSDEPIEGTGFDGALDAARAHQVQVGEDEPCLRQRSAHFAPASCSRKMPIICSSEYLVRFIVRPFHRGGL